MQSQNFSMGCGVLKILAFVVTSRNDFALVQNNGTDGDIIMIERITRLI